MTLAFVEPEPQLEAAVLAWPDRARSLTIEDDHAEGLAAGLLVEIKSLRAEVASSFDPIISKAHAAHKEALSQKKRHDDPLDEAERVLRSSLGTYRALKERRALEERRRIDDERRRLEEEQQIAEAQAAEDAGDLQAAEEVISRPVHVAPTVIPVERPKGISYSDVWKFDVTSLAALIKHCAAHPEDSNLLVPNTTAIRSMVTSRKSGCQIPGVRVWSEKQVAARR